MYKELTKETFLTDMNLPSDYHVDGLIAVGSGNKQKMINYFNEVSKEFDISNVEKLIDVFFEHTFSFIINGKRIWFDVVYGSAYLVELMHICCLLGSKKNILLGSCGALSKGYMSGDIVIPTYSYGEDSTAKMYERDNKDNKYYPDNTLTSEIKSKIGTQYKVLEGPIVTCQAMLAETREDINRWNKEGYIGVEMETSSFFAVSKHFNVPSSALLYIGDNLIEGETVFSENHIKLVDKRTEVFKHNLKIALEVIGN
jgi:purine-nucleoside phosphorylase